MARIGLDIELLYIIEVGVTVQAWPCTDTALMFACTARASSLFESSNQSTIPQRPCGSDRCRGCFFSNLFQ